MPRPDRSGWPVYVRVGLWGIAGRRAAWACFGLSLALAVGSGLYAFVEPRATPGTLMFAAALWYYVSIRWVDANAHWG